MFALFKNSRKKIEKIYDKNKSEKMHKDYYEIIKKDNFISIQALIATTLLDCNLDFNHEVKKNFLNKIEESYKNKLEMVYEDFVISWNKNLRFSATKNIPVIRKEESSNIESKNFKNDEDPIFNQFLIRLNNLIVLYLNEEKRYVEVANGIIVFLSRETENLKIAFNEEVEDLNLE